MGSRRQRKGLRRIRQRQQLRLQRQQLRQHRRPRSWRGPSQLSQQRNLHRRSRLLQQRSLRQRSWRQSSRAMVTYSSALKILMIALALLTSRTYRHSRRLGAILSPPRGPLKILASMKSVDDLVVEEAYKTEDGGFRVRASVEAK